MDGVRTVDLLGPLNVVEQRLAPPTLWAMGDGALLLRHPRVAVVGTRHPSPEGERRARKLVNALVARRAIVVSGLAQGIDTVAHTETIARGGRTIAVLGTPLDDVFPKSNAALQQRIGEKHLLVSEFAPSSPVTRGNFPRRNRTMALIADAAVIVEAGERSGTHSLGWETLRLGRPLFLLKSLATSSLAWPREMVDHGAFVLAGIEDLVRILPTGDIREAVAF